MTITACGFDQAQVERMKRAITEFQKLIDNTFAPVLRIVTKKRSLKVLPHPSMSATDGKTVWLRIPLELGDSIEHEKHLCGQREPLTWRMLCPACEVIDNVIATVFHEAAHIVFDSFKDIPEEDKKRLYYRFLREKVLLERPDLEEQLEEKILTSDATKTAMGLAGVVDGWLPMTVNVLEDIYVNEQMFQDRQGTETSIRRSGRKAIAGGALNFETGEVTKWQDQTPDCRGLMTVYCMGQAMTDLIPSLGDDVQWVQQDPEILAALALVKTAPEAKDRLELAVRVLTSLREGGLCIDTRSMIFPPPPPGGQKGEEGGLTLEDPTLEPEEGDGTGQREERDEEDATDGEAGDSDAGTDEDGDDASEEGDDELVEDDDGEADGSSADEAGSDEDAYEDNDEQAGNGEGDDESGDDDEAEGDDASSGGIDAEDESDTTDEDGGEDGDGDDAESGDDDTDTSGESDDVGFSDDEEAPLNSDGDPGEGDAIDVDSEVDYTTEEELREQAEKAMQAFMGHDDEEVTEATEEQKYENELLELTINQADLFDEPSINVREMKMEQPTVHAWTRPIEVPVGIISPSLAHLRVAFTQNRKVGLEHSLKSGPRLDGPNLSRLAMGDDRIFARKSIPKKRDWFVVIGLDLSGSSAGGTDQVIKAGGTAMGDMLAHLGIPFALYGHTGIPKSKRWNVESALDQGSEPYRYALQISVGKAPKEPWNAGAKSRVAAFDADNCNLDGHTLEFYRRIAMGAKATDKLILYFTDGAMPAANFDEELRLLKKNIVLCKRYGIHLVGVGVGNDDPLQHGLDMIRYDRMEDLPKLIKGLEKRIN